MDFGNAPKTAPVGGSTAITRADVVATHGGVRVELPPEQTVQSAQAGSAVRLDVRAQASDDQDRAAFERITAASQQRRQSEADPNQAVNRRLVIEPRTRTVVLEEKDPRTGETISQLPDETLLKLRIYSRELTERAQDIQDTRRHEVERIA